MPDANVDTRREWVDRVLGVRVPRGAGAPDPDAARAAELETRLLQMRERVRVAKRPGDAEPLKDAIAAVASGRYDQANALLDMLDGLLRSAERAAAIKQEIGAEKANRSAVSYAKLRLGWTAALEARQGAVDRMVSMLEELLGEEEYEADSRNDDAIAAIGGLTAQVPTLDSKLGGLVEQLGTTTDEVVRKALRRELKAALGAYKAKLDEMPALKELQNTELGYTPLYDSMVAPLAALDAALG